MTWGTARPVALATGRLPFVSSCTLVPVSARNVPSRAKRALVPLLKVFALALAAITLGCAAVPPKSALPAGVHGPFEGYASKRYGSDDMWLFIVGVSFIVIGEEFGQCLSSIVGFLFLGSDLD